MEVREADKIRPAATNRLSHARETLRKHTPTLQPSRKTTLDQEPDTASSTRRHSGSHSHQSSERRQRLVRKELDVTYLYDHCSIIEPPVDVETPGHTRVRSKSTRRSKGTNEAHRPASQESSNSSAKRRISIRRGTTSLKAKVKHTFTSQGSKSSSPDLPALGFESIFEEHQAIPARSTSTHRSRLLAHSREHYRKSRGEQRLRSCERAKDQDGKRSGRDKQRSGGLSVDSTCTQTDTLGLIDTQRTFAAEFRSPSTPAFRSNPTELYSSGQAEPQRLSANSQFFPSGFTTNRTQIVPTPTYAQTRRSGSGAAKHRRRRKSRASTVVSGRTTPSTEPKRRLRNPKEATVRGSSRQDYTGPGFAQLPAVLVRAPSRFFPSRFERANSGGSEELECSVASDSSSVLQPSATHRDRLLKALNGSRSYTSVNASQTNPLAQSPVLITKDGDNSPVEGIKRKSSYNKFIDRIFGDNRKRRNSASVITPTLEKAAASRKKLSQSYSSGSLPRNPFRRRSSATAAPKAAGPQRRQSAIAFEGTKRIGKRALSLLGFVRSNRNTTPDPPTDHRTAPTEPTPKRNSASESADGRDAMGNLNCCAERGDKAAKDLARDDALAFLRGTGDTDLDKFDKAYASDDILTLVKLIPSNERFEQTTSDSLHPWAANPQSIGALATTQIAALASVDDMNVKDKIRTADAIPALVEQLQSDQEDRLDAALVALSFLSIDFPRACTDMFDAGIYAPLIKLLRSPKMGARAAAAQTARNIYVLEVRYRRAFRDAGGCQALVDLLDLHSESSSLDVQLEGIYHIDDFIMFNGDEVSDCIAAIKACNTARKLEVLQEVRDNEDLRDAARQLYLRLAE